MSFENAFKLVSELVNDFKANKNYLNRKYERLDKEIDELACLAVRQVYQLYSLTADEIKIVEGEKKV